MEFSPEIATHKENSASEFARCLEPVGAKSAEPGEMPIVAANGIDIAYDEVRRQKHTGDCAHYGAWNSDDFVA